MKKKFIKLIKRFFVAGVLSLLGMHFAFAQQTSISGQVTSADDGIGIPGVNIVVKNAAVGTMTDFDGNYVLDSVDDGAVLVFSSLGFLTQEVTVGASTSIDIVMSLDVAALDEVVVVGYGSQKKSDLTGSVSSVSGETLTVAPTPNLAAGLAGKVTGIITSQQTGVPGFDDTTIRVRGASTINGAGAGALVIVDGIPRPLNRIDPNEIESITVLKDAASAAIYGSRGANGVILVTTKKGGNKKATFNFTSSYGVQSVLNSPQMMNALQFATHFNEATENSTPGADLRFSPQDIEDIRNGLTPDTNWYDEVIDDNAPITQYNLSIDGGNEKSSYFLSFGHLNQEGLYATSGFKTYSVRSNLETKVGKNLSVGLNLAGRLEETTNSAIAGINDDPTKSSFTTNSIFDVEIIAIPKEFCKVI